MSSLRRTLSLLVLMAAAIVFATFAISNREMVVISLFPLSYSLETPLFLIILLSFFIGSVIAGLAAMTNSLKHKYELAMARRRVASLQKELSLIKSQSSSLPTLHDGH